MVRDKSKKSSNFVDNYPADIHTDKSKTRNLFGGGMHGGAKNPIHLI